EMYERAQYAMRHHRGPNTVDATLHATRPLWRQPVVRTVAFWDGTLRCWVPAGATVTWSALWRPQVSVTTATATTATSPQRGTVVLVHWTPGTLRPRPDAVVSVAEYQRRWEDHQRQVAAEAVTARSYANPWPNLDP